jgi:hypothetical protein
VHPAEHGQGVRLGARIGGGAGEPGSPLQQFRGAWVGGAVALRRTEVGGRPVFARSASRTEVRRDRTPVSTAPAATAAAPDSTIASMDASSAVLSRSWRTSRMACSIAMPGGTPSSFSSSSVIAANCFSAARSSPASRYSRITRA